jgi:sugar/nucleoside kinase (ribokinase family)
MSVPADIHKRLIARLRDAQRRDTLRDQYVVIMNDFSLDHMVPVADYAPFDARARAVLAQKGGILLAGSQTLQQGGCAANTATTLGRLGVPTHFICRTSPLGRALLEFFLGRAGVDLAHVKEDGTLALMMALEVGAHKTNIMVNDIQSFSPFGFGDLDSADLRLIESATLVGVFDWCLNRAGTDLAAGLLDYMAARPERAQAITYLDTSDPAPRKGELPELWQRVLTHPRLDYLGVNENELRHYARDLDAGDTPDSLATLARTLDRLVPATVGAHTASFALQVDKGADGRVWFMPSYDLQPVRTTGAGDSWNGGNILGLLLGLDPDERLLLANAVAGYYIAAPTADRPTIDDLIGFLERHAGRLRPLAAPWALRTATTEHS